MAKADSTQSSKWPKGLDGRGLYVSFSLLTICKQLQATGREFQVLAVKVFINTISILSLRLAIGNLLTVSQCAPPPIKRHKTFTKLQNFSATTAEIKPKSQDLKFLETYLGGRDDLVGD